MGINSIINSLTILVLPLIVSLLAPNNISSEWSIIFTATAIVIIVGTCVFCCFGDAKAGEWTKIDQHIKSTNNDVMLVSAINDEAEACLTVNKGNDRVD